MKSLLGHVSIDMIETILENAFEWLVVVDDTGRIIFMNQDRKSVV